MKKGSAPLSSKLPATELPVAGQRNLCCVCKDAILAMVSACCDCVTGGIDLAPLKGTTHERSGTRSQGPGTGRNGYHG